jgi:hypothetical protein
VTEVLGETHEAGWAEPNVAQTGMVAGALIALA